MRVCEHGLGRSETLPSPVAGPQGWWRARDRAL